MTVAERLPSRAVYRCDVCGFQGIWSNNWIAFSSLAHDETCPNDVLTACGDECKGIMMNKIDAGQLALPVLRAGAGGFRVTKPRKGY